MEWVSFPDERIAVSGLPWFEENSPEVWRLPERLRDVVRPAVWHLATMPAGARLRFRTDSGSLGIRAAYPESAGHGNMSLIGQMGIGLYVDGRHWSSVSPSPISGPNEGEFERVVFEGLSRTPRDVTLYLPSYNPVSVVAIGVDDGADIEPPTGFAVDGPVVFYGSSITQGGCASRPGMSYQAIMCRELDVDFVNLGFSGNGTGDVEIAEAMAEIDAACYVLDYAQNVQDPNDLRGNYTRFISTIRAKRPDTPIVSVTPIYATAEAWSADHAARWQLMREIIRSEVAACMAGGDGNLRLIEGYSLLGPDVPDGLADSVHPNDVGFAAMARGLAPTIADVVGIAGATPNI